MRLSALTSRLALVVCAACSSDGGTPVLVAGNPRPVILAFDSYSAPLGTPIEVLGTYFPNEANVHNRRPLAQLRFEGVFEGHDGVATEVDTRVVLRRKSDGTLTWDSFGPYRNPFTTRQVVGTFEGTATVEFFDVGPDGVAGKRLASTPAQRLRFTVQPSIFVRSFRPLDSRCIDPVTSALPSLPYEIEVVAVGREMRSFSFTIAASLPAYDDGKAPPAAPTVRVDVPAEANAARAGQGAALVMPPVPPGITNYLAQLTITGHAVDGHDVSNTVALIAHPPIAVYRIGRRKLAQTYDPVMQGNCFEPGVSTARIEYTETHSETRSVSTEESFTSEWGKELSVGRAQQIGETSSATTSYSVSVAESTGAEQATSHESHWKLGQSGTFTVETKPFGLGGSVAYELSSEMGGSDVFSTATTTARTDEQSQSESQTLGASRASTTAETLSNHLTEGTMRAQSYTVSSTDSTSQGYGADIFPETSAVWYSQLSRYVTDAVVVRYNLCGQEEPIGSSQQVDWSWAVDISYGTTCSPVPAPDDFKPSRCFIGSCDEGGMP